MHAELTEEEKTQIVIEMAGKRFDREVGPGEDSNIISGLAARTAISKILILEQTLQVARGLLDEEEIADATE